MLGEVHLGDFIGQKLLILPDLNFSQSCLLRLTQPNGSTHHAGILLKGKDHSGLNQHRGRVCSYIADADKLDDPVFKAHMTFLSICCTDVIAGECVGKATFTAQS